MKFEIVIIKTIAYKKTIFVEAENKKEAKLKAKIEDWFDAGPDEIEMAINLPVKVFSIKDYIK